MEIHTRILNDLSRKLNDNKLPYMNLNNFTVIKLNFIEWVSKKLNNHHKLMELEKIITFGKDSQCVNVYCEIDQMIGLCGNRYRPEVLSYKIWLNPTIDHDDPPPLSSFCGDQQISGGEVNKVQAADMVCINPKHYFVDENIEPYMEDKYTYRLIRTFPLTYLKILKEIKVLEDKNIITNYTKRIEYIDRKIKNFQKYIKTPKKAEDLISPRNRNTRTSVYTSQSPWGHHYTQRLIKHLNDVNFCSEHSDNTSACRTNLEKILNGLDKDNFYRVLFFEFDQLLGSSFETDNMTMSIDGYTSLSRPNAISLGSIINEETSVKTKTCISFVADGIVMSLEAGRIRLTNRSQSSVFIQSENFNQKYNLPLYYVHKVYPMNTFEVLDLEQGQKLLNGSRLDGFGDFCSLINCVSFKLSFVKGWGENYNKNIQSTPIWTEIYLIPLLQLIKIKFDAFLTQFN